MGTKKVKPTREEELHYDRWQFETLLAPRSVAAAFRLTVKNQARDMPNRKKHGQA